MNIAIATKKIVDCVTCDVAIVEDLTAQLEWIQSEDRGILEEARLGLLDAVRIRAASKDIITEKLYS